MKSKLIIAFAVCVALVTACGPGFTPALNTGEPIPPGKVLVVGKFVLEPSWYTAKEKAKYGKKYGQEKLFIKVGMTKDLSKPVKEGKLYLPDEAISPALNEAFFYPLSPGTRYIRHGQVLKQKGHHWSGANAGAPVYDVLNLFKNIKITVPANAKVVYIGTIIYKHDGKRLRAARVRNEYGKARRELATMNIPGVRSRDMKKRLAKVVK